MISQTILIVDDEPQLVELLKIRLEASQYRVVAAYDGEAGWKQALQEPPHLIVLDVMMPKLNGWEVLRRLKRHEKTKAIPVIMLTAKGDTGSILDSEELRAADYFIKPFEASELLATIRKHIPA